MLGALIGTELPRQPMEFWCGPALPKGHRQLLPSLEYAIYTVGPKIPGTVRLLQLHAYIQNSTRQVTFNGISRPYCPKSFNIRSPILCLWPGNLCQLQCSKRGIRDLPSCHHYPPHGMAPHSSQAISHTSQALHLQLHTFFNPLPRPHTSQTYIP
jgi:hypothetical protein